MATSAQDPKLGRRITLRGVLVGALVVVGLASLTGFMAAHWVERQILTTDNWVEVVGPLPKDDKVASALSAYTVNQLFTATDLEDRITQALPDRAAFLAPPLADQLQTRLTNRTKQVIQSDRFESIWTTANRAASQRLIDSARNANTEQPKAPARFSLDLSSLRETVNGILEKRGVSTGSAVTSPEPSKKSVGVAVNLKTNLEKVKEYIRLVDFMNATLWLLGLVCIIGAVVLARNRRRIILIASSALAIIALLQLIGVKALQPYILNEVQDASFRPAVSVVYDTLLASFRNVAINTLLLSVVIFLLTIVLHKPFLARSKAIAGWFKEVQSSKYWKQSAEVRKWIGQYRYYLMAGFAVFILALMAFVVDPNPRSITRSVLFILLGVELISLISLKAATTRGSPMKH